MGENEEHKAAVRACFQAGTEGTLEALDAIIDPGYVLHDPSSPEEVRGIDGLRALVDVFGLLQQIGALPEMVES